jgi:predicted lipoprotein
MKSKFLLILFILALSSTSACTLFTVRTLDEDSEAKAGFNAEAYVEGIWESQFIPAYMDQAQEITGLLTQLRENESATIETYGKRTGTGNYSFMVHGEAQVLSVDTESRIGLMEIDLTPYDGTADATVAIGPVIRRTNIAAVDAVGFIQFNDFVNQTEFATVSDAIKTRILNEVLTPIDLPSLQGKTINFRGAFTLNDINALEIVPIRIEVQ